MDSIELAIDAARNALDALGDRLAAHERQANLITLWAVLACCLVLFRVKAVTYWTIRRQRDRTSVGRRLKWQKIAEAAMFLVWSAIYGLSLWTIYEPTAFGIWERLGLRVVLVVSMGFAAFYGERFLGALEEQNYGMPDRGAAQDARDVRQGDRDDRQNARDVTQQRREDEFSEGHEA